MVGRSTILIFVLVFAILGLMLGYAESFSNRPIGSVGSPDDITLELNENVEIEVSIPDAKGNLEDAQSPSD